MKKNIIKLLSIFVLVVGFSSCEDDETDFVSNSKPVITASATTYTVDEGNNALVTLTSNKVSSFPMQIKLELVSGSSDDILLPGRGIGIDQGLGSDGFLITFPANATSYTFNIGTVLDEELEEVENFKIRMTSTLNMHGIVNPSSEFLDIIINNAPSKSLNLTFDWDKSFEFGGSSFSLCAMEYDVDIIVLDSDFNDLGVTDAQTADCPEHLSMSTDDFEDGTYIIVGQLYENNGLAGSGIPQFDIPMTISYQRGGSQALNAGGSFVAPFMNSESANLDFEIVAYVTIADGVFTVKRADETIVAQGRQANIKNKLKALKSKRAKLRK